MSKDTLVASDIQYIDAGGCGSTIGYTINTYIETYGEDKGKPCTTGSIDLTDCNRKISWEFEENRAIEKIDKAIYMLQQFKKDFIKARKNAPKTVSEKSY
jgi:hypothetical protein